MGFTSDFKKDKAKEFPLPEARPTNKNRLFMTKAEAEADDARWFAAQKAAKEAKDAVLAGMDPVQAVAQANPFLKNKKPSNV